MRECAARRLHPPRRNPVKLSRWIHLHLPLYQLIKRIPRAVRDKAASIFQACLRDVVSGGTLPQWKRLHNFFNALCQLLEGVVV